jgi:hypothetical protein
MWGHFESNYDFLERLWAVQTMNFRQLEYSGKGRRSPEVDCEATSRSGSGHPGLGMINALPV